MDERDERDCQYSRCVASQPVCSARAGGRGTGLGGGLGVAAAVRVNLTENDPWATRTPPLRSCAAPSLSKTRTSPGSIAPTMVVEVIASAGVWESIAAETRSPS